MVLALGLTGGVSGAAGVRRGHRFVVMFLTRAMCILLHLTVAGASVNQVLKHISKRIHRPDNLRPVRTDRCHYRMSSLAFYLPAHLLLLFVCHAVVLRGLTGANGGFLKPEAKSAMPEV